MKIFLRLYFRALFYHARFESYLLPIAIVYIAKYWKLLDYSCFRIFEMKTIWWIIIVDIILHVIFYHTSANQFE